ncbi:hypothetical protein NL676_038680 [Syzygium grande]|nr:hypothetical protein NL676_038680 [Syzygium grande]
MMLVVIASAMMGASVAYSEWNNNNGYAWPPKQDNSPAEVPPKKIIVGGLENWHFGFDYSAWAHKNGPFYVNDTLVFKYDPPSDKNTHPHSVYVFQTFWSYMRCDLKRATMVANVSDGRRWLRVHLEPEVEVLLLCMRREQRPPLLHREDAVLCGVASSPLEVARLIGPDKPRKRQSQCLKMMEADRAMDTVLCFSSSLMAIVA